MTNNSPYGWGIRYVSSASSLKPMRELLKVIHSPNQWLLGERIAQSQNHMTRIFESSRGHRGVGVYKGWPGGGKPGVSNLGRSSCSALGSITVFWKCEIFPRPSRLTIGKKVFDFTRAN